ncbi:MAG: hypothetical protein ACRCZ9_12010, partial [Fusobacteriaceae bacterium]
FNRVLDESGNLFAEASFVESFKVFVKKIYVWFKEMLKKIINLITGKKSSGGGGGGGSSRVSNDDIKAAGAKSIGVKDVIKKLRDEGKVVTPELEKFISKNLEYVVAKGVGVKNRIDVEMSELSKKIKENYPDEYINMMFFSSKITKSSFKMPNFSKNIYGPGKLINDPMVLSKVFYNSIFTYIDETISAVSYTKPNTKQLKDVIEVKNKLKQSISQFGEIFNIEKMINGKYDNTPNTVLSQVFHSGVCDFLSVDKKIEDMNNFLVVNNDTGGTSHSIIMSDSATGFCNAMFPFIGKMEGGKFDGVPLPGYMDENLREKLVDLTEKLDSEMLDLKPESSNITEPQDLKIYQDRKEHLLKTMHLLTIVNKILYYGANVYRPAMEAFYHELSESYNSLNKTLGGSTTAEIDQQAILSHITKTRDLTPKQITEITRKIMNEVGKNKIEVTNSSLLELGVLLITQDEVKL